MPQTYVPGVCNIGPVEIRQRTRSGYAALTVTFVLAVFLVAGHASPELRLFVFLPAFGAAVCFIQARLHFCAAFGLQRLVNVSTDLGTTDTVLEAEFRAQDRRKARLIIAYSTLIAAAVAVVAALV